MRLTKTYQCRETAVRSDDYNVPTDLEKLQMFSQMKYCTSKFDMCIIYIIVYLLFVKIRTSLFRLENRQWKRNNIDH